MIFCEVPKKEIDFDLLAIWYPELAFHADRRTKVATG
jgi:hypothetical protein